MAVLVPGLEPSRVDGDLFLISGDALATLDRLETGSAGSGGPYVRDVVVVAVASGDGATTSAAQAYLAREPACWQALVELGAADALSTYPRGLASAERLKPCCVRAPGHPAPHDVVDPLTGVQQH
jgi:gamma-glutamylcyclotransferase (GGCT)/AIG2-like uncharacterized protein YtfP